MQIENRKEEVPFAHYTARFQSADPVEMAERTGAEWDGKEFYVNLMNRKFAISHPGYAIRSLDGGQLPPLPTQTFLLRWLLEGQNAVWLGQWKTFREMPWGETYQKAFAGRALSRAAFTFGSRTAQFRAACEATGGIPLAQGDAGYEFSLLGDFKIRILLWEGDEEFPPSAQILYSDNFAAGFTAEDRVVAADILISAIRGRM